MMPSDLTRNVIRANKYLIVTRAVVTALVTSFLLSACLLTRLYAFKQQFCDYRNNFAFTTADEFRVQLLNPVLLDSDVIWLAGAEPGSSSQDGKIKQMQWIVDKVLPEQSAPDPAFDQLFVDMEFESSDQRYRLQKVVMDQRFAYVVSPDLMERHAANVCNSSWLVFARSGEIDLADADLSGQPSRQEIIDYLGQPTANARNEPEGSQGMIYQYRLRGSKRAEPQYGFEFWHDEDSGELVRSKTFSIRFSSTTDFSKKKMWIQVK